MSDPAATAQRQQARAQGVLTSLVTLPFRMAGVLFGSLLLAIIVDLIGLHWWWPEEGWQHTQRMLEHELDQLSDHFTQSILVSEPARLAEWLVTRTYDALVVQSGVLDWARDVSVRARAHPTTGFWAFLRGFYVHVEAYALAASYTLLTFLVRLIVLLLSLPLFFMAALVGLIDGLVRRDLRRFGAGRESGFLYHRARACILPLTVLPWVVYLTLPVSIHPLLILLPAAIALSIAVNITAATFKKYL